MRNRSRAERRKLSAPGSPYRSGAGNRGGVHSSRLRVSSPRMPDLPRPAPQPAWSSSARRPKPSASWGRRTRPSASLPRSPFRPCPDIPARPRMMRHSRVKPAQIGYPVVLKAVAGGGGKGLKPVFDPKDLAEAAASARREALAAFGDDRMMIEKLVEPARHIEMQIFGDTHGNVVHLFERECTLQRRGQKVIEEAPAINMPAALRARMAEAAIAAARAVSYLGAGTVEFLVPGGPLARRHAVLFHGNEYPPADRASGHGADHRPRSRRMAIPRRRRRAAAALTRRRSQAKGAAVEARLYAEDPATGFLPSPGMIRRAVFPERPDVRVDSGVATGSDVPSLLRRDDRQDHRLWRHARKRL